MSAWEGLSPPYATIVADPPWHYEQGGPYTGSWRGREFRPPRYSSLHVADIRDLPVFDLAPSDAHLYLWTTNRYLRSAFLIAEAWGFEPSQLLTWCKTPRGIGPGGAYSNTTEFVVYARRGSLVPTTRVDSTWWHWPRPRNVHSQKPAAFYDLVESVSPGPYVELFARQPRLGWDSWGYGYEVSA